ncbi:MAG: PTS sugar transporter subunit IIA, partial [Tepidisphaeraceae bacterium]
VPHCKTDHLSAGTIVLGKLAEPVAWGSIDDAPVDVVILLAIPAKDHAKSHLELFARLSRLVMRDEFRDALRAENDRHRLLELLQSHLGLRQSPPTESPTS